MLMLFLEQAGGR